VRRRAHSIGAWLRRRNDEAKEEVLKITGELAGIAEATILDALGVARNASASSPVTAVRSRKAICLVSEIEQTCRLLEEIVAQTDTALW